MKKIYLILITFFVSLSANIIAQNNNVLPDFIDKDTTLDRGVYFIENNIKVGKSATLTIKAGSRIYFRKGASIRVDGGIFFAGTSKYNIEVTSEDKKNEGLGIVVSGISSTGEININYVNFTNLLVPINFEKNWVRQSVSIENNSFMNIVTGEPSLVISRADEMSATQEIPFIFTANSFIYNNSSISIESIDSDVLNIQFYNNLITSNYFYGYELGGGMYSPITIGFNNKDAKFQGVFLGNSIYNNFLLNDGNDSILQEVNFGVRGRGEKYALDNNYFGAKTPSEIQKTFDHSVNNSNAPFLSAAKTLKVPSHMTHGHVWKVLFNGVETVENKRPATETEQIEITVFYNRPLQIRDGVNYVAYSYFDAKEGKILTKSLGCTVKPEKENNKLILTIKDDIYLTEKIGFFTIVGLVDNEGFMVPKIQLGKELFNNKFDTQQ